MDYYGKTGKFEEVMKIFMEDFKNYNLTQDNYTYSIIMKSLKYKKSISSDMALKFIEIYNETDLKKEIIIYNSLLDLLIKRREFKLANKIFNEIIEK